MDGPAALAAAPAPAEEYLRGHGLAGRSTRLDGGSQVHPVDNGRRPFDIRVDDRQVTRWDAVIYARDSSGSPADHTPGPPAVPPPLFGGVFDPETEGVYWCGRLPSPAAPSAGAETVTGVTAPDAGRLTDAQARWISEYLRGRYLLPPRSVMVTAAGMAATSRAAGWPRSYGDLPRAAWAQLRGRSAVDCYLYRLGAELRRGRARAADGGYPLPVPSLVPGRATIT
jgi:hypothetical protein